MNPTAQPLEANTQAVQCADLFTSDLREAHKLACQNDAVLEILLRELLGAATRIKNRPLNSKPVSSPDEHPVEEPECPRAHTAVNPLAQGEGEPAPASLGSGSRRCGIVFGGDSGHNWRP
jgi:hypothetical protein